MLSRALSSVGRILGLGGTAAEEDRRIWGRVSSNVATTCQLAAQGPSERHSVQVKNVSPGGICLLMAGAFRPGELLRVAVPHGDDEAACEVLACVVRSDSLSDGRYEVGCSLATPLSDQEVRRFQFPAGASVHQDQRSRVRYPLAASASYHLLRSSEPSGRQNATVLNISGAGVALQVSEALHVGDLLEVELCRDQKAVATALASVVRTTVEPSGERLIGCNFLHELPENQIASLLV